MLLKFLIHEQRVLKIEFERCSTFRRLKRWVTRHTPKVRVEHSQSEFMSAAAQRIRIKINQRSVEKPKRKLATVSDLQVALIAAEWLDHNNILRSAVWPFFCDIIENTGTHKTDETRQHKYKTLYLESTHNKEQIICIHTNTSHKNTLVNKSCT